MILLRPFTIGPLRDAILRTVIKAENAEDIEAVMVLRSYTVEEIEDRRENESQKSQSPCFFCPNELGGTTHE